MGVNHQLFSNPLSLYIVTVLQVAIAHGHTGHVFEEVETRKLEVMDD